MMRVSTMSRNVRSSSTTGCSRATSTTGPSRWAATSRPAFRPQLTPRQMLRLGVFGGKYMTDCRDEFPAELVRAREAVRGAARRPPQLLRRQRLAIARRVAAERLDPSAGSARLVPVVLSLLHGPPDRRRRPSDSPLAGGGAARRRDPDQLRAGRSDCRRRQRQAVLHWAYDSRRSDWRPAESAVGRCDAERSTPRQDDRPVRVGISSCLLGEAVRFDGGHKRDTVPDRDVRAVRGMGAGLSGSGVRLRHAAGIDAPGARRERRAAAHRQDRRRSDRPARGRMRDGACRARVGAAVRLRAQEGFAELRPGARQGLRRQATSRPDPDADCSPRGCWSGSPTCRSRRKAGCRIPGCVRTSSSGCSRTARLRDLFSGRWDLGRAGALSHRAQADPDGAFARRRISSSGVWWPVRADLPRRDVQQRYSRAFMAALAVIATPRRHTNVLQHMAGYFKDRLDRESKAELLAAIDDYRQRAGAADRAADPGAPLRSGARRVVPGRPALPRAASQGADAPQSCLTESPTTAALQSVRNGCTQRGCSEVVLPCCRRIRGFLDHQARVPYRVIRLCGRVAASSRQELRERRERGERESGGV